MPNSVRRLLIFLQTSACVPFPHIPPLCATQTGIFVHSERTSAQTRKDGTVQKPTLLERYLHRPLASLFDDLDIVTYHSQFASSKSPPQYATEQWIERPWDDNSNRLLVYRRRPTPTVSFSAIFLSASSAFHPTINIYSFNVELLYHKTIQRLLYILPVRSTTSSSCVLPCSSV